MLRTDDVLRVLRNKRQVNGGWLARCPVSSHGQGRGDKNPSLSVTDKDGVALVFCHGGCEQDQVIRAITAMLPGCMFNHQSSGSAASQTAPDENSTDFTMEQHVLPWEEELEKSPTAQAWLREQRIISMGIAREFHLGLRPNYEVLGGCHALVIPTIWKGEVLGVRYRALEPINKNRKWAMERASTTRILQYADREPPIGQDVCLVTEGPLDALMLMSHGYASVAITSASTVPATLEASGYSRFKEGVELIRAKYPHIACVGDQPPPCVIMPGAKPPAGTEGLLAMEKVRNLIGPGADRYRLPCHAGLAKDVTEARMKDGEEQFRHNMDFIVSCARSNRKTPAFETTGEIITRIAISLNLHSHLHQSKLPAVVEAHIRELEKLVKPVEVGYPAFPHHVMEGTSLYEGLALPVSKTSAKHPEFLWMAAMVMELAYLFGRVAIKNHARIPYGMQLHIIGDLRRSHKSSAVEVAMDYMFRAGGTKNDSASLDRASVDGRVLIQTGGSLEGCGLRMAELGVCRCLLFYDELRKLADKAGIEGSSMVSDLLSVADAGQWANRVKRGKESFAFAPHEYCLSLITCCATEAFQDCWSRLSGSSISGLNERAFILLQPAAPKEQKRALDPDYEPAEITKSLIRKAEAQKVFDTAADAEAILDSAVNSLGVQWTSRMELLSLYFAVDLGREVIDADCVQRTEALCSYGKKALEYIRPIDAESKLAALQQKIIQALRRSPEHKLELRTLKKNLHFERYDTEMCDRALKGLQKTMPPTITIDGEQPYWVKLIWEE